MSWIKSHFLSFLLALQFFSRLPVKVDVYSPERQAKILNYLPLIGLLFGSVLFVLVLFLGWQAMFLPSEVAFFILVIWIWLSGALHLDGVADSADAALGSVGQKDIAQKILHDSRIGTGGAVALALILLGKWVFLASLFTIFFMQTAFAGYLLLFASIPFIARLVPLVLLKSCGSATASAGHKKVFAGLSWSALWGYLGLLLLWMSLIIYAEYFTVLLTLASGFVLAWFFTHYFAKKLLGGVNGDLMGLSIEISELLLILALLIGLRLA